MDGSSPAHPHKFCDHDPLPIECQNVALSTLLYSFSDNEFLMSNEWYNFDQSQKLPTMIFAQCVIDFSLNGIISIRL